MGESNSVVWLINPIAGVRSDTLVAHLPYKYLHKRQRLAAIKWENGSNADPNQPD